MTLTHRSRLGAEDGSSLIIVMAFLSFLGVLVASVLTVAFASFKTTEATRGSQDKHYGADGGADVGIQLLRASSTYCPTVSGTPTNLPNQTIDGRTVHITCQTLSGSTGGPGGGPSAYSLVLTGYNNPNGAAPNKDLLFRTAGDTLATPVSVGGDVFNAGGFEFDAAVPKVQITGNLDQYNDTPAQYCTADKALAATTGYPWSGNPTVSGAWTCRLAASFPVPDPVPTVIVPTAARPNPVVQGTCTILFPGKYTGGSSLPTFDIAKKYYFASGVYYFENTGQIHLKGETFGGEPSVGEPQKLTTTPCSNDAAANGLVPGSATGKGVEFVLGGAAKLKIETHANVKIELFARAPAVPAAEGTAGVSVYSPRTSGPNYLALNSSDEVFHMDGNKSQLVIHGMVYVPNGNMNSVYAVANPGFAPIFMGRVVAQRITIHFDNQFQATWPIAGSAGTPATPRTVVVTATSDPLIAGESATVIKAVVRLDPGAAPTVLSWRKV